MAERWIFFYRNKKMDESVLERYQEKLLAIREKYEKYFVNLPDCKFYHGELPPADNIFAQFKYECKRHDPACTGWYLVWDPNKEKDKSKLTGVHSKSCAPTVYKVISKRIQTEIEHSFFNYFKQFHSDGDYDFYKLTDSYQIYGKGDDLSDDLINQSQDISKLLDNDYNDEKKYFSI